MNPPAGEANGGAQILVVEIDPAEAASGITKTVSITPGAPGVAVAIPAGVSDGAMFRLPGTGAPAYPGGPASDVVIQVRVRQSMPVAGAAVPPPGVPAPSFGAVPPPGMPATGFGAVPQPGVPAPPFGAAGHGPLAAPVKAGRPWLRIGLPLLLTLGVGAFSAFGGFRALGSVGGPSNDPPPPVSSEAYQQALTDADKKLAAGFTSLAKAGTPAAIHNAAAEFSTQVHALAADFKELVPPPAISDAHFVLTNALSGLGGDLADLAEASEANEVCRGSAASSTVSTARGMDSLRFAATELAGKDPAHAYTFGSSLPEKTQLTSRSLANGAFVKKSPKRGEGELKITNSDSDIVVSLVPVGKKTPLLSVYVRAHQSRKVTGVPDGEYDVFWTAGKDWDGKAKAFTQNCSFAKFDEALEFTTSGRTYTVWEIELQVSSGGNAPSSEVDPNAFPQG